MVPRSLGDGSIVGTTVLQPQQAHQTRKGILKRTNNTNNWTDYELSSRYFYQFSSIFCNFCSKHFLVFSSCLLMLMYVVKNCPILLKFCYMLLTRSDFLLLEFFFLFEPNWTTFYYRYTQKLSQNLYQKKNLNGFLKVQHNIDF